MGSKRLPAHMRSRPIAGRLDPKNEIERMALEIWDTYTEQGKGSRDIICEALLALEETKWSEALEYINRQSMTIDQIGEVVDSRVGAMLTHLFRDIDNRFKIMERKFENISFQPLDGKTSYRSQTVDYDDDDDFDLSILGDDTINQVRMDYKASKDGE